jgi:hypothetical protein
MGTGVAEPGNFVFVESGKPKPPDSIFAIFDKNGLKRV